MLLPEQVWSAFEEVRKNSPLVQCITNYVAMDISANVLLAAGASPAMVHGIEEVEEFLGISSALSINIGTLSKDWVQSMKTAAETAKSLGKPWVLDPVGAGATKYRTETCLELLKLNPCVIRGNASEILALSGASFQTKGVDSVHQSDDATSAAMELARSAGCVVAVSGAVDYVTDGTRILACKNGVPLLTKITATGCSVTALIGAFLAVLKDQPVEAAGFALSVFNVAAEVAFQKGGSEGPGSLRVGLLDALHNLKESDIQERVKLEYVN